MINQYNGMVSDNLILNQVQILLKVKSLIQIFLLLCKLSSIVKAKFEVKELQLIMEYNKVPETEK